MEKYLLLFLLTTSTVCAQFLEEEFEFMETLQLNHTSGVLSSSLIECSARCTRFIDCCLINFDNHTGRCILSTNCSEVGVATSGKTFRRKSMPGTKRDCSDVPVWYRSGIYRMTPINNGDKEIYVYCDMETDRGGWTMIQRRVNAVTSFNRTWSDYKNGFGNLVENFWLGNDNIHAIVQQKNYKVRFDLEDKNGTTAYAEYSTFFVDSESTDYTLTINGYSGNAGDGMTKGENPNVHDLNGMPFSTPDRDNDKSLFYHCAFDLNKAGWWLNFCTKVNLNGVYNSTQTGDGAAEPIYWWNWRGHEALKRVEIKIKPAMINT